MFVVSNRITFTDLPLTKLLPLIETGATLETLFCFCSSFFFFIPCFLLNYAVCVVPSAIHLFIYLIRMDVKSQSFEYVV